MRLWTNGRAGGASCGQPVRGQRCRCHRSRMPLPPVLHPAAVAWPPSSAACSPPRRREPLGTPSRSSSGCGLHGDLESLRRGVYVDGRAFRDAKPAAATVVARSPRWSRPVGPGDVLSHVTARPPSTASSCSSRITPCSTSPARSRPAPGRRPASTTMSPSCATTTSCGRQGRVPMTSLARTAIDVARGTDRSSVPLPPSTPPSARGCRVMRSRESLRTWRGAGPAPGCSSRALSWPTAGPRTPASPGPRRAPVPRPRADRPPEAARRRRGPDRLRRLRWDGVVGELDGKGKYGVGVGDRSGGRRPHRACEKQREDRIRGSVSASRGGSMRPLLARPSSASGFGWRWREPPSAAGRPEVGLPSSAELRPTGALRSRLAGRASRAA